MKEHYTSYTINHELRLIITYCKGKINFHDLIQLNRNFISDKAYDSSFDILMDFRDSSAIGFKIDMHSFMDFLKENVSLPKRIRSGILYRTPNQKYLLSIYKPAASLMKIDVENFTEINHFFEWMKYSKDEQKVIEDAIEILKSNSPV